MPEAVERPQRRDTTAADTRTLEQLGLIEPQPRPSIQPFLEPVYDPPLPPADEPA